jgi:mannosyltransferase OCH1-like enzyme
MKIPQVIHQTVENLGQVLPAYARNREEMSALNPHWKINLYTADDREDFIRSVYGKELLNAYLSIDRRYGAARADFFRYLVVLELGGLYLDIKATATKSLDAVIGADDKFITAQWPSMIDGIDITSVGFHQDLGFREYQNWFILAAPKHLVLERVVEKVLKNLTEYNPYVCGVGKSGVLRTTGPIAYSKVVHQFIEIPGVRVATNEQLGLRPSVHRVTNDQNPFPNMQSSPHYSTLRVPIVHKSIVSSLLVSCYFRIRQIPLRIWRRVSGAL